jgi:endoglucanase
MPQHFPVGTPCCDATQRKSIADAMERARRWSQQTGYPLHLGEFGSNEKADLESREKYARIVRDEAEKRGIGWAYWEFASSFGVYSPKDGAWVEPIRRALLD